MSRLKQKLARNLLMTAILHNRNSVAGMMYTAYEYESPTCLRVLVKIDQDYESDILYDKVTGCWRLWIDGVELGSPECN